MSAKAVSAKSQPKDAKIVNETMIKIFGKICTFVSELNTAFGSSFHFVELYNHLLLKTKLNRKQVIQQHINAFKVFFERNMEALGTRDVTKIVSHRISYSDKVYIDVYALLNSQNIDKETTNAIWTHLLMINATIDPSDEAREILLKLSSSDTAEGKFLGTFFDRIQKGMESTNANPADPMSAISSLMGSGVINEMMGSINNGVNNGSLDIGKLFQMVQGMMGSFSSMSGNTNQNAPMGGMDLGGMLGMLMGGGMGGGMPPGMGEMMAGISGLSSSSSTQSNNSFTAALDAEKVQKALEERIEAEARLEMAKEDNARLNAGPTIELLEDNAPVSNSSSSTPDK
jgi:hypothetical protein